MCIMFIWVPAAIKKSKKENSGTKKDWLNKTKQNNKTNRWKKKRFCHFLFWWTNNEISPFLIHLVLQSHPEPKVEGRTCSPCLSHSNTASKTNVHWSLPWAMMNHMKKHKYKSTYHKSQRPTNLTDLQLPLYHTINKNLTQAKPDIDSQGMVTVNLQVNHQWLTTGE